MIFVTVGAQMPFDRLARCVDAWTGTRGRDDVFAQIGTTDWRPLNMRCTWRLDPVEFRHYLHEADVVITHAGVGTILTALELGKPILVMPRRGDLLETRNDHQLGTAHALARDDRVSVAWDEQELFECLDHLDRIPVRPRIPSHASLELLTAVRGFIRQQQIEPPVQQPAGLRLRFPVRSSRPATRAERKAA